MEVCRENIPFGIRDRSHSSQAGIPPVILEIVSDYTIVKAMGKDEQTM